MTLRLPLLLCTALLAGCLSMGPGGQDDVLQADLQRIDAMVSADRAALEVCLHESLTYTHSTGAVDSRETLIETLTGGSVDYRAIVPIDPSASLFGDIAIVTTATRIEGSTRGDTFVLEGAYTAVYRWESGRWQLLAYHSSPRK